MCVSRCVGESAIVDGDIMWPGAVRSLALCLVEVGLGATTRPFLSPQPEGAAGRPAARSDRRGAPDTRLQYRFHQGHFRAHAGARVGHEDQPDVAGYQPRGTDQSQGT